MKTKRIAFYCIAILMGGCVPVVSLQPLFTTETAVFNAKLLGTWGDDGNQDDSTWEFERLEPEAIEALPATLKGDLVKAYRLNLREKTELKGSFVAALVKLQDQLYLDIWPDKLPSGQTDPEETKLEFNAFLFLPAHTFLKVDLAENSLTVRLTNIDEMEKLLAAEPKAVAWTEAGDRLILTASTKELQDFVTKYADHEHLFTSEVTLARQHN